MSETAETTKIGKWDVPKKLYDEYVKFRMFADAYRDDKCEYPGKGTELGMYERRTRCVLCVQRVMELHREICVSVGVEYSDDLDDEFCNALFQKTTEDTKLKG